MDKDIRMWEVLPSLSLRLELFFSPAELIFVRDLHPFIFGSQERVILIRGGVPGADDGFVLVVRQVEQRRWSRRPSLRLGNTAGLGGLVQMLMVEHQVL